jgi:GNAT superfamily N-acetyltransferase
MIEIRPMTIHDLQLGLRLSQQAGWNQTKADWLRFLAMEPTGCFVAESGGLAVGTTTTCILGHVAWIAMVLVDIKARSQGVGTQLLRHALGYLEQRKVQTIRLDATPAGQPIYAKLGFEPEYELARFEGTAQPSRDRAPREPGSKPAVAKATPEVFADIIEFDKRMTGTDRTKMLMRLFEEFPEDIRVLGRGDKVDGFATVRPGARAVQIGPCTATTHAGPPLLRDALSRCAPVPASPVTRQTQVQAGKPVFVDVPLDNAGAVKIAESSGLRIQRCFMRMCRGEKVRDNVKGLWASSGPEKG